MGVNAPTMGKQQWLIGVIILILFAYKQFSKSGGLFDTKSKATDYIHALLLDQELQLTEHAKCRMDCRTISFEEVKEILLSGKVNWKKSNKKDQPCPTYALEGLTTDNQYIRIVFADCKNSTKVITAIDLDNDYNCSCN